MRISPFVHSSLSICILILLGSAAFAVLDSFATDPFAYSQKNYSRQNKLLNRYVSLSDKEQKLTKQLEKLNQSTTSVAFLRAAPGQAERLLQEQIRSIASQNNLPIGTVRGQGIVQLEGGFKKASITMGTTGLYQPIAKFIQTIERVKPTLQIKSIRLVDTNPMDWQERKILSIQIEIEAIFKETNE